LIDNNEEKEKRRVATLPLHQRLALIRHCHGLDSNADALSILKKNGE